MSTSTINANIAECIKSKSYWGYDRFTNICNGTVTELTWGITDWMALIFFSALLIAVVLGLFMMFRSLFCDIW